MAKLTFTSNNDSVVYGAGKDYAIGRLEDLSSSDIVSFGGGEIDDVVILTTAGIIDFQAGLHNAVGLSGFERLDLAVGTNLVILTGAVMDAAYAGGASAGWFTVRGNLGDDEIIPVAFTGGVGRLQFVLGGGGDDRFSGTDGNDVIRTTAAELNQNDVLDGTAGVLDTIRFDTAGVVDANAFANISGFEVIQLNAGGNDITLSQNFGATSNATGSAVAIFANGGLDRVNASALTTPVYLTVDTGLAVFQGGAAADKVFITVDQLNNWDHELDGGAGLSTVLDVLTITGTGVVSSGAFRYVTGFERIVLATPGISVQLRSDVVTSGAAGFAVIGTAGTDSMDASQVFVRVGFNPGAGSDVFIGGPGDDQINMTIAQLDGTDSFDGGAGRDRIGFLTSGTITAAMMAGLTSIETFSLSSAGPNTVTLGTNLLTVNVAGGSGVDTVTLGLATQYVSLGDGDDTLIVTPFTMPSDTSYGGNGTDTIQVVGPGSASIGAGIVGFEFLTLGGATTLDIVNTVMALTVAGSTGDDRIILGSVGQIVNAGDGIDFVQNGSGDDTLDGGNGSDWLEVTGPATDVDLAITTAQNTGYGLDTISNFENLRGAGGDDLLHGDIFANELDGQGGNDLLEGRGGGDILTGGLGDDSFRFNDVNEGGATITDYTVGDHLDLALAGFITDSPMTSLSVYDDLSFSGVIGAGTNVLFRTQSGIGNAIALDNFLANATGAPAGGIFVLTDDNGVVQLWFDPAATSIGGGFEPTLLATITLTGIQGVIGFTASDFSIF